jgi:hypothetical protein
VGGDAYFRNVQFQGSANFDRADIGKNFFGESAKFTNAQMTNNFSDLKVGGSAYLDDVHFAGPVCLNRAQIGGNLDVRSAEFTSTLPHTNDFQDMRVSGNAFFTDAVLAGPADFAYTDIGGIFYANRNCFRSRPVQLGGIRFHEINAGREEHSCTNLLSLLMQATFSDDIYENSEALFRRTGNHHLADTVYIERRWREREGLPWFKRWWNLFLWSSVGYGRRPWLAFLWSAGFVVLGYFIFRESKEKIRESMHGGELAKMEQQKSSDHKRTYNAFWYSLDLLAPAIDLHVADFWKPKEKIPHAAFYRSYVRVQRILGWILIPIGLAALTGIIR